MFKLIVLGNNGPFPAKDGACSGYLLQYNDTNILLDLGSGSLANLISVLSSELDSINAIILTHLHSDHISDISVLRYAVFRSGNPVDRDGRSIKIPLYCPPAPELEYETLCSYPQFDVQPITDDLILEVNGLTLSFAPMRHPYPVYAVSATTEKYVMDASDAQLPTDGRKYSNKFVYTGDTSWNLELVQFAEGADLMLADANYISQDRLAGKPIFHLTAEECGIAAAEAGVTRLLLTHFTPGSDIGRRVAEAKAGAQKVLGRSDSLQVEVAQILTSYEI